MEIKIAATNDNNFYEELVSVTEQALILKRNPEAKLNDIKKRYTIIYIVSICLLAVDIFLLRQKQDFINIITTVIFSLCSLITIFALILHNKNVKIIKQNSCDTIVIVDEKGLKFVNEKTEVAQSYAAIDFIIVGKYGSYVIPLNLSSFVMGVSKEYQDVILNQMLEYEKDLKIYRK